MNYTNLFKIAVRAIAANKTRSFLTALGIIIGIASVITMLAVGQGTKQSIQANIAEMGSNMIMIGPGADRRGGVRQDASSMETLKMADYEAIKDECTYISAISPTVTKSGQFIYGNENTPSTVYGVNQDYLVLAPYTAVMKRILAQTYLGGIQCSAITEGVTDKATEQITDILRRNHKLKDATDTTEADEDDFNIRSQEELASMMNSTTDMLTILLGCVAGISLVVGGIGIMNIMYVSVTERTREIGLRMSVGARGVDILDQFLIEAIMLSVTGGIIGVLLGFGASYTIKALAHWPIAIEPWTIIMSFAVCTFTGVFFGWYPAKKAAQLDPIEALRYE